MTNDNLDRTNLSWAGLDVSRVQNFLVEMRGHDANYGPRVTPRDKAKRLTGIAAKLDVVARLEVELILAAANEGQHIWHRPAVSMKAQLGIVVKAKGKNPVAA